MYELITAPLSEPITLAEAKAQCRVDGTDEDTLITSYIIAARMAAEEFMNRAIISQTVRLTLNGWPAYQNAPGNRDIAAQVIEIHRPWVQSITSLKYIDTAGTEQTLSGAAYRLVSGPNAAGRVMPAYGTSWPSARSDEGVIKVDFVTGWVNAAAVPQAIKQAILFWVAHFYANRESVVIGSIATEIPQASQMLLWPFRYIVL